MRAKKVGKRRLLCLVCGIALPQPYPPLIEGVELCWKHSAELKDKLFIKRLNWTKHNALGTAIAMRHEFRPDMYLLKPKHVGYSTHTIPLANWLKKIAAENECSVNDVIDEILSAAWCQIRPRLTGYYPLTIQIERPEY